MTIRWLNWNKTNTQNRCIVLHQMVRIVNAVGSGSLATEVDLQTLSESLDRVEYDPEGYHGATIRRDDGRLIIIYRTGSYIIRGGSSVESLLDTKQFFFRYVKRNIS